MNFREFGHELVAKKKQIAILFLLIFGSLAGAKLMYDVNKWSKEKFLHNSVNYVWELKSCDSSIFIHNGEEKATKIVTYYFKEK